MNAILHKPKSGCQWRLLPIGHLFSGELPGWNTVFHHLPQMEPQGRMGELVRQLANADIPVDGLFCDLDAGFDGKEHRRALICNGFVHNVCPNPRNGGESTGEWIYDGEMYKERWKIERTNPWLDGFKSILNRFDITIASWKGWYFLAFIVIFL